MLFNKPSCCFHYSQIITLTVLLALPITSSSSSTNPATTLRDETINDVTTPNPDTPESSQTRNIAVILAVVLCITLLVPIPIIVVLLCVIKFRKSKMKADIFQMSGGDLGAGFYNTSCVPTARYYTKSDTESMHTSRTSRHKAADNCKGLPWNGKAPPTFFRKFGACIIHIQYTPLKS